jgi:hypothetical protein
VALNVFERSQVSTSNVRMCLHAYMCRLASKFLPLYSLIHTHTHTHTHIKAILLPSPAPNTPKSNAVTKQHIFLSMKQTYE